MFRRFILTIAVATLFGATPTLGQNRVVKLPAIGQQKTNVAIVIEKAAGLLDAKDYTGAAEMLRQLVTSPEFTSAQLRQQGIAWFFLGLAEEGLKFYDAAYGHMIKAGETAPDIRNRFYWLRLASAARRTDHNSVAADALTQAIVLEPARAREIYMPFITTVVRRSAKLDDQGVAKQRLLEALVTVNYTPDEPFMSTGWMWWSLFEIYVAKGDEGRARRMAAKLDEPEHIASARVDHRYRSYTEHMSQGGDYQEALDREVLYLQANMAAYPELLAGPQRLAYALLKMNRLSESLAILDEAIAQAEASSPDKPTFSDAEEQYPWVVDTRSRVLAAMGRWDDVIASQEKARDIAEQSKQDTVSQAINLGGLYYRVGRPTDALKAVATTDSSGDGASPYGIMSAEEVRACAYAQLKDHANLAKSMDYMKAHADDGYGPYRTALMCSGDTEGLAALIISHLDDSETRNQTLIDVQTYLDPLFPTAIDTQMKAVWTNTLGREDVQKTIEQYGVIESWPVTGPFN